MVNMFFTLKNFQGCEMKKIYIIWNERILTPNIYPTINDASEAKTFLMLENPGVEFIIMKSVEE